MGQVDWNAQRCIACLWSLSDYYIQRVTDTGKGFSEADRQIGGKFRSASSQYARAVALDTGVMKVDNLMDHSWNKVLSEAVEKYSSEFDKEFITDNEFIFDLKSWLERECFRMEDQEIRQFKFVRVHSAASHCESACFHLNDACKLLGFIPYHKEPLTTVESHESDEARRDWEETIIAELKGEVSVLAREEGIGFWKTTHHGDFASKFLSAAMNYAICLSMERGNETAEELFNRIHKVRIPEIGSKEHRLQLFNILEKECKKREKAERDVYLTIRNGSPAAHAIAAFTQYSDALQQMRQLWQGQINSPHGADDLLNVEAPVGDLVTPERIEREKQILGMLKAWESAWAKSFGTQEPHGPASFASAAENAYANALALEWLEPSDLLNQKITAAECNPQGNGFLMKLKAMLEEEAKIMTDDELRTHGFLSPKGKAFWVQRALQELSSAESSLRED